MELYDKSVARIGTCKALLSETEKLKASETDWKKIFIQYKARTEKRQSWKEKQKLYKEMEEKLAKAGDEMNAELNESEEKKENKQDSEEINNVIVESQEDSLDGMDEELGSSTDGEDDESDNESEAGVEEEKETKKSVEEEKEAVKDEKIPNEDKKKAKIQKELERVALHRKLLLGDDNDVNDDKEAKNEVQKQEKKKKEFLVPVITEFKRNENYKPWLTAPKLSKESEIKQIDLSELANEDEIPIDAIIDDKNESSGEKVTVKRKLDSFFLTEDGQEIEEDDNQRAMNNRFRRNFDEGNGWDGDGDRRFGNSYNSSFVNSLSSNRYGGRDTERGNWPRSDNNYNNSWQSNDRFDGNSSNNRNFNNQFYNEDKQKTFGSRNNSFNRNAAPTKPVNKTPIVKEDISSLHPSWQAKKAQEQKLKNLSFQGKKVKFDDDE